MKTRKRGGWRRKKVKKTKNDSDRSNKAGRVKRRSRRSSTGKGFVDFMKKRNNDRSIYKSNTSSSTSPNTRVYDDGKYKLKYNKWSWYPHKK